MNNSNETDSAMVINIQDMIADKVPIPHHLELGHPNSLKDQLVEVRAIDIPVTINIRRNKSTTFLPGKSTSNIEYIIYTCILMNDLFELDNIHELIPDKPDKVHISINKWFHLLACDEMPESWFIQHRNDMLLMVDLEIEWPEENKIEPLCVPAGLSWGKLVGAVEKRSQLVELAQVNGIQEKVDGPTDYSAVQSKPVSSSSKPTVEKEISRKLDNFITDASDIFR